MAGKYPTKEHIAQVFSHVGVGDYDTFFSYVAPDVGQYTPVIMQALTAPGPQTEHGAPTS